MRHTPLLKLSPLLLFAFSLFGQGTPSIQFTETFTSAGTTCLQAACIVSNGPTLNGGPQGAVAFRLVYYIQPGTGTVSALSIELDGAATSGGTYTALTPAAGGGSGSGSTLNPVTSFPNGQNVMCCDYYPFLELKVNTLTVASGTPVLIIKVIGYAGTSAAAGGGSGGSGGSVAWNAIVNPNGNQALFMNEFTSTWTFGAATGAGVNMVTVTDTGGNTGTGLLLHITTAAGSAASPWGADANGVGCSVTAVGQLLCTGNAATGAILISLNQNTNAQLRVLNSDAVDPNSQAQVQTIADSAQGIIAAHGTGGVGTRWGVSFSKLMEFKSAGALAMAVGTQDSEPLIIGTNGINAIGVSTSQVVSINGTFLLTNAAPTVAAAQVGLGSTTAVVANCGAVATACLVINVAGTTRYIPYY